MLCAWSQSSAFAVDRPSLLGGSNPSLRTEIPPHQQPPGTARLSSDATQLAINMQLLPKLIHIEQLRSTAPNSIEYLALKQDVMESIVMAGYEAGTVTARIDRELANAGEVLGYLAERRDRAVRLNSYADFISGGITGIVSGSMNLGETGGKAPDTLDTIEGALQTSLATWALRQQRGEKRRERGMPSILAHLFQTKSAAQPDYPPAVWAFLSAPLPASKTNASRLDVLVDRWLKLGVCFTHRGHRVDARTRIQHVAPSNLKQERLTIDVLEDRIAMLNDLRATVVEIDAYLLELTQCVHGVRVTGQ